MNDIKIMKETLLEEANAMINLAETLGEECSKIIELILNIKGRLIITGMGKSGHIGKKIAATLASTGTPSFFVHPGEASHGDLGMITSNDAVIAISNSGESKELGDIITYTRRFSIPLISISRNSESTLGKAADYHINLNYEKEACPLGIAPTTSTTLTLAIGDALAVALLKRRGFSAEDFGNFHPGGKLGAALIRNEEIMHDDYDLPLAKEDTPMNKVIEIMSNKKMGCVGIVDNNNKLVGMITDGDIRRHVEDIMNKTAKDIMTANPITTTKSCLSAEGLAIMNNKSITALFVVDEANKPIGIIHMHDYLKNGVM
ncbi:MAG: KpsF/GutQ family sugar-phosphate isomerase [Alphaproteobacteria bacterium]|jgi:arabinose-5-phosphate isomerase|nr:KpsF/GutQ family sugar-phosphate isomerase [Alphaproteobacteria bacterium]